MASVLGVRGGPVRYFAQGVSMLLRGAWLDPVYSAVVQSYEVRQGELFPFLGYLTSLGRRDTGTLL